MRNKKPLPKVHRRRRPPIPNPEQLYLDHIKLIQKMASSFASTTKVDVSDYLSLADEVFVRCMRRWNPTRGKFSTLLWVALNNAFIDLNRAETKRASIVQYGEPLDFPTVNHYGRLWLTDFMDGLKADAREVVRLLFEEELPLTVSDASRYVKSAIRKSLTGRGRRAPQGSVVARFTPDRVNQAFSEIETAISEEDYEQI